MEAGVELGIPAMASIQSIAIIKGRPCLWGDALIGVVRSSPLCLYVKEWIEGDSDKMIAYCETHRRNEKDPVCRSFSVFDAQRAGLWKSKECDSPWWKYPKRMLQMRARAWCLRDVYADILKGVQIREEVEDYAREAQDVPVSRPTILAKLKAEKPANSEEGFNREHLNEEAEMLSTGEDNLNSDEMAEATDDITEAHSDDDVADYNFNFDDFLKELAEAVISVTDQGERAVVEKSKLFANGNLDAGQKDKARDVVTIAREIARGETPKEDGVKRIAGIVGIDYRVLTADIQPTSKNEANDQFNEEKWLKDLALQLYKAIASGLDEYESVADRIYPSEMNMKLSEGGCDRAKSIYNLGLKACKNELSLENARIFIADVANLSEKDLQQ
ncbi:hypothetical protein [Bartonella apis]|uniref:hypothetical protein n=2 Tax=Bartonella TaxID=773 RepID=UPI0024324F1D|nr:hypothetical protein [Bartonella apis]MCT6825288.1 recombinase RecT [Bartonella apis]MCT6861003.1 recombinase RecT [Bartonella apis]